MQRKVWRILIDLCCHWEVFFTNVQIFYSHRISDKETSWGRFHACTFPKSVAANLKLSLCQWFPDCVPRNPGGHHTPQCATGCFILPRILSNVPGNNELEGVHNFTSDSSSMPLWSWVSSSCCAKKQEPGKNQRGPGNGGGSAPR